MFDALTRADEASVSGNQAEAAYAGTQEVRGVAKKTAPTPRGAHYLPSFHALRAARQPDRKPATRRFETLVALKKR
jgi:uracil-DNA glycosylase